jgi:DNA replication and repair protein RecF
VGICGANGTGKTNLLDAVYYLSFSKSYFSRTDSSNVYRSLQGFRIEGNYTLNNRSSNITCILRENNKKEFYFDKEEYKKLSEHIGKIPCVMIAPDDVELITGAGELRRKFIDVILSQINDHYIQYLITYNNLLQQRNSILKQCAVTKTLDITLLNVLTEQLAKFGTLIFEIRSVFLNTFLPLVTKLYCQIAATENDNVSCSYQSQLQNNNLLYLLNKNLETDMFLQRTNTGIHKDDIEILMNGNKFKADASQGQRKSLLFALKLAEWQTLKQQKGFPPILLLDDVFEKLDAARMHNLMEMVSIEDAQIFITDTHKERLEKQLLSLNKQFEIIEL